MEPEITTTLFHLGETFYDYFDSKIENNFQEQSKLQIKIVAETNRQTILPQIYSMVSDAAKETLLKDIHRYVTRKTAEEEPNVEIKKLCRGNEENNGKK